MRGGLDRAVGVSPLARYFQSDTGTRTLADVVVVPVPKALDEAWVDAVAKRLLSSPPETVDLNLDAWSKSNVFSEARLLQLLVALDRRGQSIGPSLARALPDVADRPHDPWWDRLRNDVASYALVQLADTQTASLGGYSVQSISRWQNQALYGLGGEIGVGPVRTLLAVDRPGAPKPFRPFSNDGYLTVDIEDRLRHVIGGQGLNFESLADDQIGNIVGFLRELLDNTREHATTRADEGVVRGLRFCQFRRLNISARRGSPGLQASGLDLVSGQPSAPYFSRLFSEGGPLSTEKTLAILATTIADSGSGIAAKLAGSEEVYDGPIELEQELLRRALTDRTATSVRGGLVSRGSGLPNVLEAVRALSGLFILRTGRSVAVYDGSVENGRWEWSSSSSLAGTSVSLFVPWLHSAQVR